MAFAKAVYNGYILGVGVNQSDIGISEEEYNIISDIMHNRPVAPAGYKYMLRADNLEWELVENPTEEPEEEEPNNEQD